MFKKIINVVQQFAEFVDNHLTRKKTILVYSEKKNQQNSGQILHF
jgi:hypothetical protein